MKKRITILCGILLLYATNQLCKEPRFVIVIASYNNKKWYKENLNSIFAQDYPNFRVIYTDDNSPDGTADEVENYVQEYGSEVNFKLVRNQKRRLKVANLYAAIHQCEDDEIIVELDGDDWFFSSSVLSTLADVYRHPSVWMTYGQYIEDGKYWRYKSGRSDSALRSSKTKEVPERVIAANAFRDYYWVTSHLRTYYAWLFKSIKLKDLIEEDNYYSVAGDVAITFPMLEMAGKHSLYIPKILYVWNNHSPINDFRKRPGKQVFTEWKLRKKRRYTPLEFSREEYLKKFEDAHADVILITQDPEGQLESCLSSISSYVQEIDHVEVLYPKESQNFIEQIKYQWSKIGFTSVNMKKYYQVREKILMLLKADEHHTILMNDVVLFDQFISLKRAIKELECTRSYAVLLHLKKDEICSAQTTRIFDNVYAWNLRYRNCRDLSSTPYMILYRNKHLRDNLLRSRSLDGNASVSSESRRLGLIIDWAGIHKGYDKK